MYQDRADSVKRNRPVAETVRSNTGAQRHCIAFADRRPPVLLVLLTKLKAADSERGDR